jgi:hypothetical protein
MPGQDSKATERQALLGSHASARQILAARRSRAADRSEERHGSGSVGVRVQLLRGTLRHLPTERSIAVRVKPIRNWVRRSYCLCDEPARCPARARGHVGPAPERRERSRQARSLIRVSRQCLAKASITNAT